MVDLDASHDQSWGGFLSSHHSPDQTTAVRASLRRSHLYCVRLAIVLVFMNSWTSARPFIPQTALPPLASLVLDADDNKPEQLTDPDTWVAILCFLMILAGFGWAAWACARPETLRYSLQLLGLLSLTVSIAWTAILYSVDTNDNRRYLALGCWSMFIIAFVSETYHHVQYWLQYTFAVVPTFLTALHLTLFSVNQHAIPGEVQTWNVRQFYENAPLVFTLWVMLLCWIYHRPIMDDQSGEGGGDNSGPGDPPAFG